MISSDKPEQRVSAVSRQQWQVQIVNTSFVNLSWLIINYLINFRSRWLVAGDDQRWVVRWWWDRSPGRWSPPHPASTLSTACSPCATTTTAMLTCSLVWAHHPQECRQERHLHQPHHWTEPAPDQPAQPQVNI